MPSQFSFASHNKRLTIGQFSKKKVWQNYFSLERPGERKTPAASQSDSDKQARRRTSSTTEAAEHHVIVQDLAASHQLHQCLVDRRGG
jgi:hypothetical protein